MRLERVETAGGGRSASLQRGDVARSFVTLELVDDVAHAIDPQDGVDERVGFALEDRPAQRDDTVDGRHLDGMRVRDEPPELGSHPLDHDRIVDIGRVGTDYAAMPRFHTSGAACRGRPFQSRAE